jgi:hypothetical protein
LLCICNIFVLPGMYRYIPVCTSSYWYVPVHTGISLYIPVCNSTYMYRLSPSQYKPGTRKYVLYTHTYNTVHTLAVGKKVPIAVGNVYVSCLNIPHHQCVHARSAVACYATYNA